MKTFSEFAMVAGLVGFMVYPAFTQNVAPSGLANGLDGYWTFDETTGGILHDSSGNGFNGTVVNYAGGQGNWTPGLFGNALQFGGPGTGQYVSVPNFAMPTTSMTLAAWVWADSVPRWATVAANWNGGYGAFNYATFGGTPNMSLYTADARVQGGINVDYGVSTLSLAPNQWHFLAFVANASSDTVTFMQDGNVAGSFQYRGQLIASSSQLNIGDDPSDTAAGQGNWDGRIDDLAIWSRALSSQEISDIYNAGLAGQPLLTLIPEPSIAALLCLGMLMFVRLNFSKTFGNF
jgi:hypothetical protein